MRVHAAAAGIAVLLGGWVRLGRNEWLWILASIAFVWTAECVNTAVERTVDMSIGDSRHPLAKVAKDAAAAAVLVASLFALAAGLIILLPAVIEKLR